MSSRRLGERLTEDPLRELLREVVERRLGLGHRGLHAGARQRHGRGQRGERRARQEPGEVYRHARGDEPRDENHELARAKEEGVVRVLRLAGAVIVPPDVVAHGLSEVCVCARQ